MTETRVLVGGVGQLYQGDLDVARAVLAALSGGAVPEGVVVEDLSYGAVAVAQRLEELRPEKLVLVGAAERGRPPGTVERRAALHRALPPAEVQRSIADAVTGYVSLDLVLEVASGLGVLPAATVVVEVEPAATWPSEELSPEAAAAVAFAAELVREEAAPPIVRP